MLDIGWPELLLIGAVALIFIGPKDLPRVLKTMGQWVGQIRKLTREFRSAVDDMIREAELDEVTKTVNEASKFDLNKTVSDTLDPDKQLEKAFEDDWKELTKDDDKTPGDKGATGQGDEAKETNRQVGKEELQP